MIGCVPVVASWFGVQPLNLTPRGPGQPLSGTTVVQRAGDCGFIGALERHSPDALPSVLARDILLHFIKCVYFPVHPFAVMSIVANQCNQLGCSVEFLLISPRTGLDRASDGGYFDCLSHSVADGILQRMILEVEWVFRIVLQ